MKKEKKKTRRCLYKCRHILLIRVISFKSRHPETTSPKTNEKKGRRRKFIVDNYGQFQSRRKKREKEKKNPLPIFSTDIIRRSRFVGLNKIHKKSRGSPETTGFHRHKNPKAWCIQIGDISRSMSALVVRGSDRFINIRRNRQETIGRGEQIPRRVSRDGLSATTP